MVSPAGSLKSTAAQIAPVDRVLNPEPRSDTDISIALSDDTPVKSDLDKPQVARKDMDYRSMRDFERQWIVSSLLRLGIAAAAASLSAEATANFKLMADTSNRHKVTEPTVSLVICTVLVT